MKNTSVKFEDYLNAKLKNPRFKKHFEEYDLAVRLAVAIAEARVKAGLTQEELGKRMRIPQSVIARLESGDETNPELQTIQRLAKALAPHFKFTISSRQETRRAA